VVQCRDLDPAELLLAGIVRQAVRDACQEKNERVRYEAQNWLWTFAPIIAERANVPSMNSVMGKEAGMGNIIQPII
jgi:hypothetical protein